MKEIASEAVQPRNDETIVPLRGMKITEHSEHMNTIGTGCS